MRSCKLHVTRLQGFSTSSATPNGAIRTLPPGRLSQCEGAAWQRPKDRSVSSPHGPRADSWTARKKEVAAPSEAKKAGIRSYGWDCPFPTIATARIRLEDVAHMLSSPNSLHSGSCEGGQQRQEPTPRLGAARRSQVSVPSAGLRCRWLQRLGCGAAHLLHLCFHQNQSSRLEAWHWTCKSSRQMA